MEYLLKSGVLTEKDSGTVLAKLKHPALGEERRVLTPEGTPLLRFTVCTLNRSSLSPNDVRRLEYRLLEEDGSLLASARPGYAGQEDPAAAGWPICRAARVDHAQITHHGTTYRLLMQDSSHYALYSEAGLPLLQIDHLGIMGGWQLRAAALFPPRFLLGIFLFCRCLDRENEFAVV